MAGMGKLFVIVLAAILVGSGITGGIVYYATQSVAPSGAAPTGAGAEKAIDQALAGTIDFCVQNPSVDLNVRAQDTLDSVSTTYRATHFFVAELDDAGNVVRVEKKALTTTSGSYQTFTDALTCGKAYKIIPASGVDGNNSAVSAEYVITKAKTLQDPVKIDLAYPMNFSTLRLRAKDRSLDQWVYNTSATVGDVDNTDFIIVEGTIYQTGTNGTAKTIIADEELKYTFWVKTTSADNQAGERCWFGVDNSNDGNPTDWGIPVVDVDGTSATDATNEITANDKNALNAYEYVFDLNKPIGEKEVEIELTMPTGAGVNADYDPTFRFACTGVATDAKDPNKLIGDSVDTKENTGGHGRAFGTDSSRTQIVTAKTMSFQVDIS